VATLLNWSAPLLPIHILWINLVTDSLPALALGVDPAQKGIMKRKPNRDTSLLNKGMIYRIVYQGSLIAALTITAFLYGSDVSNGGSLELGRSMAFCVLAFSQLAHSYNIHSNTRSVFTSFFVNKWLIGSTLINVSMMLAVLFIPGVNTLFKVVPIDIQHWEVVIGLSLMPLLIVEVMKLLKINGK
jgi:Ca2+-transporting ATPase